jgi:hypothetical protein
MIRRREKINKKRSWRHIEALKAILLVPFKRS